MLDLEGRSHVTRGERCGAGEGGEGAGGGAKSAVDGKCAETWVGKEGDAVKL